MNMLLHSLGALNPSVIGKVVSIQVFQRRSENSIEYNSLKKYVGVLEAYTIDNYGYRFKIQGLQRITIESASEYVELYLSGEKERA